MDGDSLVTSSTTDTGDKLTRRYDFSEDQVILVRWKKSVRQIKPLLLIQF